MPKPTQPDPLHPCMWLKTRAFHGPGRVRVKIVHVWMFVQGSYSGLHWACRPKGRLGQRAECDLNSRRANMNPTLPYLIQSNTWMLEGPTWTHSKPDSGQMLYPLFGQPFKNIPSLNLTSNKSTRLLIQTGFHSYPNLKNCQSKFGFFRLGSGSQVGPQC